MNDVCVITNQDGKIMGVCNSVESANKHIAYLIKNDFVCVTWDITVYRVIEK